MKSDLSTGESVGQLIFVGLGLHDDLGISLRGLEELRTADIVFMELYTSLLPAFSLNRLESAIGKKVQPLVRRQLEEEGGSLVLNKAATRKVVLLVPGDPLIATTHVSLRIDAEKKGIQTRLVHGASIQSAVIGLSGLHNYKFGKTVTIPFPDETPSETPYETILQNKTLDLHTLCLLDISVEKQRFLTINEALEELLHVEERRKKKAVTAESVAVAVARAGSDDSFVKADYVRNLMHRDFGRPPFSLVFPGVLHFLEAEALVVLANGPPELEEDN